MNNIRLNSGTIARRARTSETQPDYRGKLNVRGALYEIVGWTTKNSETGEEFIGLRVEAEILPHEDR